MTVHMNGSPADLGVKAKLRLQSHDQNVNDIPYKPAIEELRSISSQVTLLGKLESLGTNFEFIQWIWKKFHQGGVYKGCLNLQEGKSLEPQPHPRIPSRKEF